MAKLSTDLAVVVEIMILVYYFEIFVSLQIIDQNLLSLQILQLGTLICTEK